MKFAIVVAAFAAASLGCKSNAPQPVAEAPSEESTGSSDESQDPAGQFYKPLGPEEQAELTPDAALERMKEGNRRFMEKRMLNRDLLGEVKATSVGQYPAAIVLACVDSRSSPEIVFDQGMGDIFSARIAGNVIDEHTLGSMEFGARVAGAKLIVVMGHTACGAVKGACDNVELGHVTSLVNSIKPSVEAVESGGETCTSKKDKVVDKVTAHNAARTVEQIRERSDILAEMERDGELKIVSAMYDISTGKVSFK